MAFCTNCGAQLPDSAAFCTECGAKINTAPVRNTAPEENYTAPEKDFNAPSGQPNQGSYTVPPAGNYQQPQFNQQQYNQQQYNQPGQNESFGDKLNNLNNTADTTNQFAPDDIEKNKIMAILAYLSWLVLVPIIAAKNSPFARFHANQGLVLAISEFVALFVIGIFKKLPVIGWIFSLAGSLVSLACFVLMILGIINAANGRAKELPIVGKFRVLQ